MLKATLKWPSMVLKSRCMVPQSLLSPPFSMNRDGNWSSCMEKVPGKEYTSEGDKGNDVHQVLANFQVRANKGNGWLRIMNFIPAENKINLSTYSPVLERYDNDKQSRFALEYCMTK